MRLSHLLHTVYTMRFFIDVKNKEHFLEILKRDLQTRRKKTPSVFFYINAGSLCHIFFDKKFYQDYKVANHSYLNSSYIGTVIKLLYGKEVDKLNAEDFIFDVLELCEHLQKRVFIIGATGNAVNASLATLEKRYPKLYIRGFHGYFTKNEVALGEINEFKPDILFVGLGLQVQEKWIYKNIQNLSNVNIIITIGNFIDILGKERKLPPSFFKQYQVEWLYRLGKEPTRLWRRYLLGGIILSIILCYGILLKLAKK